MNENLKSLNLTKGSHKKVEAYCEFNASETCSIARIMEYREFLMHCNNNDGKYICLPCSRKLKASGRNNPNCKHENIDDSFFKNIDSEIKAYLLGWIISDGSISESGFTIKIHEKDIDILQKLNLYTNFNLNIIHEQENMVSWTVNSKEIRNDLIKLCNLITFGKKSHTVEMPDLSEDLALHCIRGIFDGDGSTTDPSKSNHSLRCTISSSSQKLLDKIKKYINIPCSQSGINIEWSCNNALDFMGTIYKNSTIDLNRKKDLYHIWCNYVPTIYGKNKSKKYNLIKFCKTKKNAILPDKSKISDSGYDLTIIEKIKESGDFVLYDTGIKCQFDFGYYGQVVPRSSIVKTGYILANNIGIIDRSYLGNILIGLIKIDKSKPDLELPCRIAQIIPTQIQHFEIYEMTEEEFNNEQSARNSGGFGSTGK